MSTCIVLNGASSSGKSSIAGELQRRWPGPLQVSGIDTFLACQSAAFFGLGVVAPGFSWLPEPAADGSPAYRIEVGPTGSAVLQAAQAFWRACASLGLDQVIDDVWLTREQVSGLGSSLAGRPTCYVGVRCPLEELERRERERGDRTLGTARGQYGVVHSWGRYDIEVDTSRQTSRECAEAIVSFLAGRG
jgi:chloramphenicol 3-O phosphotransferase